MQDQGAADETEAEAWRDKRNQHRSRENRKDDERPKPRHAPRTRGHVLGVHARRYLALEDVVGNVDAHEQPCVKRRVQQGFPAPGVSPRNLGGKFVVSLIGGAYDSVQSEPN